MFPILLPTLLLLISAPYIVPRFSCHTLLGELLYAYITARPDIGYATTLLAKFSTAPAKIYYQ